MKTLVLLSGGLDSSVNLALAKEESKLILALTIAYGQKAEKQELRAAKKIADYYQVPHRIVNLDFFHSLNSSSLISNDSEVPKFENINSLNQNSAEQVWVPNRNGLFVNLAACIAEAMKIDRVITGFNKEEAATFLDNSAEFVEAINRSLEFSTLNGVTVSSYTIDMTKSQIVAEGKRLKLPFELIWSCYLGEDFQCGSCESCIRLKQALNT